MNCNFLKAILLYFTYLAVLRPGTAQAQLQPAYDSSKGFFDYQKKMNAYYTQTGRVKGYNQWKRQEWYFSTRVDRTGRITNMQKLKQEAIRKSALIKTASRNLPEETNLVNANWTPVGPNAVLQANEGIGRVNRLAFHPTNANIIWAATAGGGLWKTTNGGGSWTPLTDGLPNMNLQGVAVNPQNTNTIYILTGDGDTGGPDGCCNFSKYSTGVLKSTDGGITWRYTGLKWEESDSRLAYKLIMHPSDTNILFVGSRSGLYRTTNAGNSWSQIEPFEKIYDIEFMPNNSQVVYFSTTNGKFFRSVNSGLSWTPGFISTNPTAGRVSIAVSPANSSAVYLLISNNPDKLLPDSSYVFNGIWYSGNMGVNGSWGRRAAVLPNVFSGNGTDIYDGQQNYDHAFAVNPFNINILATGGVSIFVSSNGGNTVSLVNSGPAGYHVDIHELVYGPSGNTIYATTDGGVYKSNDSGVTWTAANGSLAITQYYRISGTAANSVYLLGGAQDNGSHLRNVSTSVFQQVKGKDGMDNAIGNSDPGIMYVSAQHSDFYKSYNGGSSAGLFCDSSILAGHNITIDYFWVNNLVLHPDNDNIVFIGYQPIVRGIDIGGTWTFTALGTAFSPDVSGKDILNVAKSNPNVLYAGDNSHDDDLARLWRSGNGGLNWDTLIVPFRLARFTRLAVNPDNSNEIWLTYGGYEDGNKVFQSLNGGQSWTNISGSLPNIPVNCIVYDDNNGTPDNALYIGTDIGVFYRDNNLGDWIPFSNGLPVTEVTDLELNEQAGLLRAGTYGRGIWQTAVYDGACSASLAFIAGSHPSSEPGYFAVSNNIISEAKINGAGANIIYKAGRRITLTPGFRVDASTNARFMGILGPCPGGGVPPVYKNAPFNGLPGFLDD